MASAMPTFPANVRLATPADVSRLSIVAVAGASTTQEFKWMRPLAAEYPEDSINAWASRFVDAMQSDDSIVLVIEDP